ncbi:YopX family protein [Evansella clarkii]|uniref:YopX family protein n=1 Tax=Evansella clarkii TaxID=79879 RepID=UPI0009983E51|nr:YopX family protein [Evansella clarkii]
MREIKYQGWHKEEKKMLVVMEIDFDANACTGCYDLAHWWRRESQVSGFYDENGEITLREFIGIKDKNCKEIYEGDFVKRQVFAFGEPRTFIGEVKMFEGCWWIDNGTAAVPVWNELHQIEVIGNIYENPELLEECR